MLKRLAWDAALSVGNDMLDSQHRHLLDLLDTLADHAEHGVGDAVSEYHEALNNFADFLRLHYRTEENLLAAGGYPALEEHKEEHIRHQSDLLDFFMSACDGHLDKAAIHDFICTWLVDHVVRADLKYKGYV